MGGAEQGRVWLLLSAALFLRKHLPLVVGQERNDTATGRSRHSGPRWGVIPTCSSLSSSPSRYFRRTPTAAPFDGRGESGRCGRSTLCLPEGRFSQATLQMVDFVPVVSFFVL